MCRKYLTLILAIFLMIPLVGCGIKNLLPSKEVPPLEGYSTVVLVPFDVKKPSGQYEDLPIMLSYSIGTSLSVRYQDRNWIYDQSREITPVSDKLKELNLSAGDIYRDPQAAAKLAESLQADLVIAGQAEDPEFTREDSGKIEEDKSKLTVTGAARYYAVYQTAILRADVKLITKAPQEIWDGRIYGYTKYKTRYRTGNPKKFQREETMLSDVRKDFVAKFVDKLYPVEAGEGE
jgi:hypothetical protein